MSRWGRAGVATGLAAAVLYVGAVLGSRTGVVRERVEALASRSTGYAVAVESAGLDWGLDAYAAGVRVAAAGREPFLTAESVDARGLVRALIGSGAARVRVAAPRFRLADWVPPVQSEEGPSARRPLSLPAWIEQVDLRDGFVETGRRERPFALGPIDVGASAVEASTDLRLAGTSALPGRAGDLAWSARIAPGGERLTIAMRAEVAHLQRLAGELDVALPAPFDGARASVEIDVDGAIAAPLTVSARGSAVLGSATPPFALEGSGTLDLAGGRLAFEIEAKAQEPERPIAIGSSELRLAEAKLTGSTDLATGATDAKVAVAGVGWKGADGSVVAERIALRGDVGLPSVDPKGERAVRFDLRAESGELLLASRYYVDLRAVPVALAGLARKVERGLTLSDGSLSAKGLGRVTLAGSWTTETGEAVSPGPSTAGPSPSVLSADVAVDLPDVAPAFALAARDPWQEAFPVLAGAEARGPVTGRFRVRSGASGGTSLAGRLKWQGSLAVASPDVRIGALAIDLPLLLGTDQGEGGTAQESGSAKLDDVSVGGVAVGPVELAIEASREGVALARPATVPALAGQVVLTELAATELTSSPEVRLGLRASGVRLAPIATAAGLPAFGGVLDGEIPRARLAGGKLDTEGEIVLRVFGGTVRLRSLRADDVGSGFATVALDASFDDVSLGELTDVLAIGHISGIARGGVEGLEVQAGTPVRFAAWLETVSRSGVSQRIGVDAIRKLSILGGSGGDPFSSGVLSFFDEYGYAKIGFRSTLEGDRLTLEGIEQRDGKDFLVVGSLLPPRVDVVSHTRTIAFSEMVSRLKRAIESEGPRVE